MHLLSCLSQKWKDADGDDYDVVDTARSAEKDKETSFLRGKEKEREKEKENENENNAGRAKEACSYKYSELVAATNNFRVNNLIGEGGFGGVYKGLLDSGQVVAIKKLDRNGFQGNQEFIVEVLMLSLLHHPNLVTLLGYCTDKNQRLLVYKYMPMGSLEDHLFDVKIGREPLRWSTRLKIAVGAARGLEYLHLKADPPVIYRDLKSSNILLDREFNAKLSDFGLAKLGPVGDKTHVSTRVMGTYGYCAPEYARTGKLTPRSDIYSFGVVLLELITGRRAIDNTKKSEERSLIAWCRPFMTDQKKFVEMADPLMQGRFSVRSLHHAIAICAMCLQDQPMFRPQISDVVTALEFLASQAEKKDAHLSSSCKTLESSPEV